MPTALTVCAALSLSLSFLSAPSFAASGEGTRPAVQAGTVGASFASAEEAMAAFAKAVAAHDVPTLRRILGRRGYALLDSGDPVDDKATRERFSAAYAESHKLETKDPNKAWIVVGKDAWALPVPVVKHGSLWQFDAREGQEELLNRRIGRNELYTAQSVLAYVDAQQEYYQRNPQKDKLNQYAQRFISSAGKRDGLYFPTKAGEKPSPLGPLFDAARAQGYVSDEGGKPAPYHGYYYKILKAQGPKASGGAYNYVVNGRMIGGFALVAYPASYGNSGIMTFIVSHDGVVYEKNLGKNTTAVANQMSRFNPDDTWKRR